MGTLRLEFSDGGDRPRTVGDTTLLVTAVTAVTVVPPPFARILWCDALDVPFYVAIAKKGDVPNAQIGPRLLVRPGRPSRFYPDEGATLSVMLAADMPGTTVPASGAALDFSDPANSGQHPAL